MTRIALVGLLLILVAPATAGPNALGCFTRTYDRAHLARHPDQVVTAVKLHIYRPPPSNLNKYWFLAQYKLRGRDETPAHEWDMQREGIRPALLRRVRRRRRGRRASCPCRHDV